MRQWGEPGIGVSLADLKIGLYVQCLPDANEMVNTTSGGCQINLEALSVLESRGREGKIRTIFSRGRELGGERGVVKMSL